MTKAIFDKYFTSPKVVDQCLGMLNLEEYDHILEPSAGCGSFFAKLPKDKSHGSDISPDIPGIVELDFYSIGKVIDLLDLKPNSEKRYLSVGNPPFGKMARMAIDFFNGCAVFSDTIAFILPRTFRKASVINRLDCNFKLRQEVILPKNSFRVLDPTSENLISEYDVPCTFQIWDKSETPREKLVTLTTCEEFSFVTEDKADFAVRRVGVKAGCSYNINKKISSESHYFIKEKVEGVKDVLDSIVWDYDSPKYDTVGNPSISKDELIRHFKKNKKNT